MAEMQCSEEQVCKWKEEAIAYATAHGLCIRNKDGTLQHAPFTLHPMQVHFFSPFISSSFYKYNMKIVF